jgi:hypothetical protein
MTREIIDVVIGYYHFGSTRQKERRGDGSSHLEKVMVASSSCSVGVLYVRHLGLADPDECANVRQGRLNGQLVDAGVRRPYFSPHDLNYDAVYGAFTKVCVGSVDKGS